MSILIQHLAKRKGVHIEVQQTHESAKIASRRAAIREAARRTDAPVQSAPMSTRTCAPTLRASGLST